MPGKYVKRPNPTSNNYKKLPSANESQNEETGGSEKALRCSSPRSSQKDEVGPLLKKRLEKGDLWYVIYV